MRGWSFVCGGGGHASFKVGGVADRSEAVCVVRHMQGVSPRCRSYRLYLKGAGCNSCQSDCAAVVRHSCVTAWSRPGAAHQASMSVCLFRAVCAAVCC
jgi:hypothetical protein